jgi:diacylglycerol O-acyltransferase / wax synthase
VANVVISNVPGPPVPLYLAGAKLTSYFPVSIVTHGLALNITIHSYAGNLDYGFIAAKTEVPRLDQLVKYLQDAHAELIALAMQQKAQLASQSSKIEKSTPKKRTTKRARTASAPKAVTKKRVVAKKISTVRTKKKA